MKGDDKVSLLALRHGPVIWAVSAVLGIIAGAAMTSIITPFYPDPPATAPTIPVILIIPFGVLLLSIAVMPFISARIWHRHFPDFAFALGGLVVGYYLAGFDTPGYGHGFSYGQYHLIHAALEYYSFIALVGGLYVVSGGILIRIDGRGRPLTNTLLLLFGAIIANVVGTTGASVLLIRPFMRLNQGRLRPIHVVMFIFIVSNCGGCLTPVGDPPLYLGFLKGVPFFWTVLHLWKDWLLTNGALLAVFFIIDTVIDRRAAVAALPSPAQTSALPRISIEGRAGLVCLFLMVAGVLIDPGLALFAGIKGVPLGATFQIAVAIAAYRMAPKPILDANEFSFFPVKEVGLLFIGIFLTMVPALGYLAANGDKLGLNTPTSFYFGTGVLSAILDNAPTYLNFLQVAVPGELNRAAITALTSTEAGVLELAAISTGAVFFGAMTYIGNGPNFMVRAIAEAAGLKMPSFFSYLLLACLILLPVLVLNWLVLIR